MPWLAPKPPLTPLPPCYGPHRRAPWRRSVLWHQKGRCELRTIQITKDSLCCTRITAGMVLVDWHQPTEIVRSRLTTLLSAWLIRLHHEVCRSVVESIDLTTCSTERRLLCMYSAIRAYTQHARVRSTCIHTIPTCTCCYTHRKRTWRRLNRDKCAARERLR